MKQKNLLWWSVFRNDASGTSTEWCQLPGLSRFDCCASCAGKAHSGEIYNEDKKCYWNEIRTNYDAKRVEKKCPNTSANLQSNVFELGLTWKRVFMLKLQRENENCNNVHWFQHLLKASRKCQQWPKCDSLIEIFILVKYFISKTWFCWAFYFYQCHIRSWKKLQSFFKDEYNHKMRELHQQVSSFNSKLWIPKQHTMLNFKCSLKCISSNFQVHFSTPFSTFFVINAAFNKQ